MDSRPVSGRYADGAAWMDLPGARRDALREIGRLRSLPEDTLGYWLLRYNRPWVVVRGDCALLICHLAIGRPRELFVPYLIRMLAHSDLVLTTHGTGRTTPLRTEPVARRRCARCCPRLMRQPRLTRRTWRACSCGRSVGHMGGYWTSC